MEIAGSMRPLVSELLLKRFEEPDEVQDLGLGRFELVRLGAMAVGRAICLPGWRWSEHVRPRVGRERCDIEHLGLVIASAGATGFADGRTTVMRAGDLFYVPPEPHDSWVVGDELFVSLHFPGTEYCASKR
jgi:hypothetical protein